MQRCPQNATLAKVMLYCRSLLPLLAGVFLKESKMRINSMLQIGNSK
jgi:hypothetical protein